MVKKAPSSNESSKSDSGRKRGRPPANTSSPTLSATETTKEEDVKSTPPTQPIQMMMPMMPMMLPMNASTDSLDSDEPKRKRGRPSKKDQDLRAQVPTNMMPMWHFGMGVPVVQNVQQGSSPTQPILAATAKTKTPKGSGKKKTKGTGKPRGRPRTRPRPGETIEKPKLFPLAPAHFSVYGFPMVPQATSKLDEEKEMEDASEQPEEVEEEEVPEPEDDETDDDDEAKPAVYSSPSRKSSRGKK